MWGTLLQVGGALLGGAMANQGAQAGADAAMAGNAEAIEEQRRQFNAMLQLMLPAVQSEMGRRNVADAFLGIPSTGTGMGNALNLNSLLGPQYAGGSSAPDGSLPTPLSTANAGLPSVSQMISGGNDPSLYNAISNGNISNEDWWATGGPSLSMQFAQGLGKKLGLPHMKGKGDGGSAVDQWGTPDENAGMAGQYDYAGYVSSNPDLQRSFSGLSDRDQRYALTAYDIDGDGRLSQSEYGQMHYEQHGQKEGRAISPMSGAGASGGGTGTTTGTAGTGSSGMTQQAATDLWKASPFYTSAQSGFDKDRMFLEGSAATGGKLLSGATLKALDDRGAYRAADSASTFYNALIGQPSSANATNLAQNGLSFGNQMSNALRTNGNIQSQLAQTQSANWMRALGGATQAIGESGWLNG